MAKLSPVVVSPFSRIQRLRRPWRRLVYGMRCEVDPNGALTDDGLSFYLTLKVGKVRRFFTIPGAKRALR